MGISLWLHLKRIARGGRLEYSVWSDVFYCPNCGEELCLWDVAVDTKKWALCKENVCTSCETIFARKDLERVWERYFDEVCGESVRRAKKVRVWDVWKQGKIRQEGAVKKHDQTSLQLGASEGFSPACPVCKIVAGDKTSDPFGSGITWVHQYWTPRTLIVLSEFYSKTRESKFANLLFFTLTSALDRVSLRNGYRPQHKNNKSRELGGPLPGIYIFQYSVLN